MTSRILASRLAPSILKTRLVGPTTARVVIRTYENITYSGGQASSGQGGFYGSGGARVMKTTQEFRPELLAIASDVEAITKVMNTLSELEHELSEVGDNKSSPKAIELRAAIKKLMSNPEITQTLNRLEVKGEPAWGLSSEERELIIHAREKVNAC